MEVIESNPKIIRDTVVTEKSDNSSTDTTYNNYYNDGVNYVTIKIETPKGYNEYTFRYLGDKDYWKSSNNSEIFICYAYDHEGNGGSEGNGGVEPELLNELTAIFEEELVIGAARILNVQYKITK